MIVFVRAVLAHADHQYGGDGEHEEGRRAGPPARGTIVILVHAALLARLVLAHRGPAGGHRADRRGGRGGSRGVTCSAPRAPGKTMTMAATIEKASGRRSSLPQQDAAAQLFKEFRKYFPNNAVEYFVSYYDYYQPEAYIPQQGPLHREGRRTTEIDRLRHGDERRCSRAGTSIIVASVTCIFGLGSPELYNDNCRSCSRAARTTTTRCSASSSTCSTTATTWTSRAARSACAATFSRSSRLRGVRLPHRVLRRRDRAIHAHRPADRRAASLRPEHRLPLPRHTTSCPRTRWSARSRRTPQSWTSA